MFYKEIELHEQTQAGEAKLVRLFTELLHQCYG